MTVWESIKSGASKIGVGAKKATAYASQQSVWAKAKHIGRESRRGLTKVSEHVLEKTGQGARYIAPKAGRVAGYVQHYGVKGAKYVAQESGRGIAQTGRFVGHEVKQEVKRVAKKKIKRGVRIISGESQESSRGYRPYRRHGGRR